MTRTLLLTLGTLVLTASQAQTVPHDHRTCGSHKFTKQLLEQQGLSTDLLHQLPTVQSVERGGPLNVPVVVHVVWNTAAENVPTSTINALISELNADYSGTNTDLGTVRPTFQGVVGNPGFQFCLAQVDPSGNATTGIVRVNTSETWFDPDAETDNMKMAPNGSPAWDPTRYLNIWICDITSGASGSTITVGYAYLPVGGVVGTSIDGLVVDYDYGTSVGARTATHEIGHYLGLLHTFDEGGACVNSDGFTDTPTSNSPTFSCSNTSLMKCGVLTQYENFMDYSNCTVMFTDQQAAYMTSVLMNERSGLLTNSACSGPVAGVCIPTSTNGPLDGDYINGVTLGSINNTNSGSTTGSTYNDYSATLSTNLARGTAYTITIQGGSYAEGDHYAAWIDYDQDDTFEASEKLGEFTTTAAGEAQLINFTVPAGAALGNTVLRVRGVYHNTGEPSPTDPCYSYGYGETEDYGIVITTGGGSGLCIPTSTNGPLDGDYINGVTLGSINNTNSGSTTGSTYNDYSATLSTNLARGTAYTITIQGGSYAEGDHYAAWIDYDQDDTFEASEKLGEFTTTAAGEAQLINFTVPAGAALGNTVLRVRGVYHNTGEPSPTDPCYSYGYGETEDYGIVITTGGGSGLCIPTSTNGTADGDFINAVILHTIENSNSGGITAPAYSDLRTQHFTTLVRNGYYGVVVESGTYTDDSYAVWIDFDQNGTFSDAEKLGEFATTAANEARVIPFSIPSNAPLGNTTMRVRGAYLGDGEPSPMAPCYNYAYGETEDYGITIAPAPSAYCTPYTALGPVDGDFINSVSLGTISNLNSGGVDGPRYSDHFNTHSTTLLRNTAYTLLVQGGDYYPDVYAAWIDYSGNGSFEATEKIGEFTSSSTGQLGSIDFTVPADAPVGVTRMRVRSGFIGAEEPTPFDPCYSYIYGETEDYQVLIQFATATETAEADLFALWPNPTTGLVHLRSNSDAPAMIEVLDMQGRLVMATTLTRGTTTIDVSTLATGTYSVRVQQNNALYNTRLEVVQQ